MAKVYSPEGSLLCAREIARWANKVHRQAGGKGNVFSSLDFYTCPIPESLERLKGLHCDCGTDGFGYTKGEFILLPLADKSVITGGKAYMRCRVCGKYSHL